MTTPDQKRAWKNFRVQNLMCDWHRKGVPAGATKRFFVDGCPRCLEKLAAGQCARTDPTPRQIWLAHAKRSSRFMYGRALEGGQ